MAQMPSVPAPQSGVTALAPRPSPQSARIVQFSCQRLLVMESEFAAAFHAAVCELTPSRILLTPHTGPELSAAVAHCVLWAALTRDPVDRVERTVEAFAVQHRSRGFPDDAYGCLGHALLRSVRAVLPNGWSSELSSGWVAYALWLQPHLLAGAHAAVEGGGTGPGHPDPTGSLDVIFAELRARYFQGQERALRAVCTRVMLRTGVDLRAPRPEQRTDPTLIAQVLESLLLMGYAPGPALAASGSMGGQPSTDARAAGEPVPGPVVTGRAVTGPIATGTAGTGPIATGALATGAFATGPVVTGTGGGDVLVPVPSTARTRVPGVRLSGPSSAPAGSPRQPVGPAPAGPPAREAGPLRPAQDSRLPPLPGPGTPAPGVPTVWTPAAEVSTVWTPGVGTPAAAVASGQTRPAPGATGTAPAEQPRRPWWRRRRHSQRS